MMAVIANMWLQTGIEPNALKLNLLFITTNRAEQSEIIWQNRTRTERLAGPNWIRTL